MSEGESGGKLVKGHYMGELWKEAGGLSKSPQCLGFNALSWCEGGREGRRAACVLVSGGTGGCQLTGIGTSHVEPIFLQKARWGWFL